MKRCRTDSFFGLRTFEDANRGLQSVLNLCQDQIIACSETKISNQPRVGVCSDPEKIRTSDNVCKLISMNRYYDHSIHETDKMPRICLVKIKLLHTVKPKYPISPESLTFLICTRSELQGPNRKQAPWSRAPGTRRHI